MSVVTETFWTGVAGIAVGAEYMSEQVFKSRHLTTFLFAKFFILMINKYIYLQ